MDVSDKFQEIWIFLAHDGFVTILEEMPIASVALVEGNGIPGHEATHNLAEGNSSGPQKGMEMVWNKRPGIALGLGLIEYSREALEERRTVLVVFKYFSSFDPSGHNVLEKAGSV
jgi:hypothetical protein